MMNQGFRIGAHVRLLWDIQTVQQETIGLIVQCYHSLLGLYEVLFDGAPEPIVVHGRYLELLKYVPDTALAQRAAADDRLSGVLRIR